jgi:hypothetical protein
MGEERSGLNIRLELVSLARVEGVVYSATGSASAGTEVVLQRQDGNLMMGLLNAPYRAQTSATGQYLLRNVAPGHYRVLARSRRSGDSSVGPVFWATADVTISGQDQTGLTLQLQPGLTLAGRIVVEQTSQASPPDLTRVMALTVPIGSVTDAVDMLSGIMSVAGGHGHAGRADGTFEAAGLIPGVHLLSATTVGAGPASVLVWRVGSVVVDGRDVTDLPFDIKAGALPKEVVVTLTDVRQRLSGVIADSSGRPLTASTVLLFPTDRRYWYSQSQRVLAVRPSTDGSYEFGGFVSPAAGEYFLSVVTDMDPSQQYDPIFLDALAKAGPIRLILARGEHRRQDLKVR